MVCCVVLGFLSVVACSYCLGVFHPAATPVTIGSGIGGTGGALIVGFDIKSAMAETMVQNSLARSCTSPCIFKFFY